MCQRAVTLDLTLTLCYSYNLRFKFTTFLTLTLLGIVIFKGIACLGKQLIIKWNPQITCKNSEVQNWDWTRVSSGRRTIVSLLFKHNNNIKTGIHDSYCDFSSGKINQFINYISYWFGCVLYMYKFIYSLQTYTYRKLYKIMKMSAMSSLSAWNI